MSTPHNSAHKGDIAKTVLMPGDPLRAKYIAENFLTDIKTYNSVRGMFGFTGFYKGAEVSVQGSGMGMPSMGIYSYELFNFYDVQNIIRVGSAGALDADIKLREIVIGMSASTNSDYSHQFELPGTYAPSASWNLLEAAVTAARSAGAPYRVGNILSSDTFYDASGKTTEWARMGVLAVEMEAAALYMNAAHAKKNALTILTVSDNIITGEATTAEERQTGFTNMMKIALETAISIG